MFGGGIYYGHPEKSFSKQCIFNTGIYERETIWSFCAVDINHVKTTLILFVNAEIGADLPLQLCWGQKQGPRSILTSIFQTSNWSLELKNTTFRLKIAWIAEQNKKLEPPSRETHFDYHLN